MNHFISGDREVMMINTILKVLGSKHKPFSNSSWDFIKNSKNPIMAPNWWQICHQYVSVWRKDLVWKYPNNIYWLNNSILCYCTMYTLIIGCWIILFCYLYYVSNAWVQFCFRNSKNADISRKKMWVFHQHSSLVCLSSPCPGQQPHSVDEAKSLSSLLHARKSRVYKQV